MEKSISLLVNCLNEYENLLRHIVPITSYFDEVIVVDMQSNDGTRELIKRIDNAIFIEIERMGYVEPARKIGIEACTSDYIFILDADEVPSDALMSEITKFRKGDIKTVLCHSIEGGLMIPRLNSMLGEDILWGKFSPTNDKQLRFFKKNTVLISDVIHSGLAFKGHLKIETLPFEKGFYLYHHHSSTALEFISRLVRYCEYEKKQGTGKESFNVGMAIKSFIKEYIVEKGFLHGKVGFALAYILSLRAFLKGK